MRANEIEFEARLKRMEKQERPRIDESNREYREKREQLNAVETARREREFEFEERIKRLEDQDRQRGSRRMEADDESVKDKEQTCESNNGLRNTKNGNETRFKEDEFEARLNAIELAKVEIERNITLGSKNNDGGTKPKEAKEDVSKLTPTVDRQFPFPKFSRFSGDEPRPKSEATYEEWKYEVNCAQESGLHSEQVMAQAIRKSLANQAKRVIVPMGTKVTVTEILERLETVFGNVVTGDSILEQFHTAVQKQDETVVAWGLRLEELMQKAIDKGHVKRKKVIIFQKEGFGEI